LTTNKTFDSCSFFWGCKTCGTIFTNYRQIHLKTEFTEESFTHEHQGANDAQVPSVVGLVCFHGSQAAVAEHTHEERLRDVVQVLAQRQYILPVAAHRSLYQTALQATAPRTDAELFGVIGAAEYLTLYTLLFFLSFSFLTQFFEVHFVFLLFIGCRIEYLLLDILFGSCYSRRRNGLIFV